ncbi:MAG: class I SAM-dependent methyltransferase [Candidatus Brocadia sp. AMX2]|uniref:Phosphatidylethanolamine methyltransferase n=1 Tax=Candidatus Brocadia sinica JPN1 TaxID=1197129 RepID=A0ABQ0JTA5_9BACT|nr:MULTISPECIES: class I SAM-dependent methyltransferase [Brocadia]MBC6931920.1 class I SAM-dependent methyltransferase [Candidatus Brocadia sp.]MBL1168315.1 class I SAM-dependent methyltransferase [Candidatus Brocadia sp. AMX1]NOG43557.1 class I SAM-dependent methyltransferase [Planctomycetota bacterium]NUO03849.1 methyltransferase domain-containing protein [Candidatus Brocadia sinica]KAA0243425.1 MAG: class I SAM-dependent methyltransferase [Candidatus Brocadia sp. AMX2]
MSTLTPEMESFKVRLKATWMAGDFTQIARSYESGATEFIERLNFAQGTNVLDVACGTGNLAIPAARRGAIVTGVDIAINLLAQGRSRAQAEGLTIQFDEGDAEKLPYNDASFDIIVSMFGVMFAPRPEKAAQELTRVCRTGGRIALANWTPTGFIGQVFKTIAAHVPPPPLMPSPVLWGDEETVCERLRENISDLRLTRRLISFKFPFTPADVVEFWRVYYGPTQRAFEALTANPEKQVALRRDLERLWLDHNQAKDNSTHVESEYLEVIATRR